MSLRGVLRGFGLKVGPTTPRTFAIRVRELIACHTTLSTIAEAMLAARDTLFSEWQKLEKRLRSLVRDDNRVRRLMTTPGVGTSVALTYVSAIDDPGRFRSSKTVGAHFGLTPVLHDLGGAGNKFQVAACFGKLCTKPFHGIPRFPCAPIWGLASTVSDKPGFPSGLGRQGRKPRKCWLNCRFLLSPVASVRTQPPALA